MWIISENPVVYPNEATLCEGVHYLYMLYIFKFMFMFIYNIYIYIYNPKFVCDDHSAFVRRLPSNLYLLTTLHSVGQRHRVGLGLVVPRAEVRVQTQGTETVKRFFP